MRQFLNTCASIEDTIAAIYRHLAASVPCDDRLKEIWLRMAEEEEDHAMQIRFAARLPADDTFKGEVLTRGKAEQLLSRAKTILDGARTIGMTRQDALRVSIKLEGEFLQVHVASAAEFLDKRMKEMFQRLSSDEEQHVKALKNYYSRYFENDFTPFHGTGAGA